MTPDGNKEIVKRYVNEIVNQGNIELVDSLFAAEMALHLPSFSKRIGGRAGGRDIFRQLIGQTRIVFPDMHLVIEDMIAEEDKVFTRGYFSGTYHGVPIGLHSPGRIVEGVKPMVLIPGMTLFRLEAEKPTAGNMVAEKKENVKIAEIWVEENFVEVLRQLGIHVAFPPELAMIKGWSN